LRCRCIKDKNSETRHARQHLKLALVDSIDEIIQRIYADRPKLPRMVANDTAETTVKTMELIDLCYNVSLTEHIIDINIELATQLVKVL